MSDQTMLVLTVLPLSALAGLAGVLKRRSQLTIRLVSATLLWSGLFGVCTAMFMAHSLGGVADNLMLIYATSIASGLIGSNNKDTLKSILEKVVQ